MIRNLEHLFCVESLRDQGSAWRSGFSHRKEGISSLLINTKMQEFRGWYSEMVHQALFSREDKGQSSAEKT